jgi:hypothetical protein
MPETTTVQSRIAGLAGDNTQIISGVAIGNNDLTRGLEQEWKLWSPDELRAAAASLEGTELNPLHSSQTVGHVTKAGFDPDRGVIYEAELSDEKLAENIEHGDFEVSIEAKHSSGGTVEHNGREAMLATNIRFTGMAIVQRGAAPSASAEPGEAAALSPAAIHEALADDGPASTEGHEVAEAAVVDDGVPIPETLAFDAHEEAVKKAVGMGLEPDGSDSHAHAVGEGDETVYFPGESREKLVDFLNRSDTPAALAEVNGETVDLSPPEAVVNAAEAALDAKEEYDTLSDCGTGVGETRAEQIVNGELSAEDFTSGGAAETAIPDYLNSHSEDVDGIADPPTEWSEETWTDGCGPVQYALWGGTATGTGLEWAQSTADAVEAAMEDAEESADAAGTDDSVSPETGQDEDRRDLADNTDTTTMGDNTPDPQQRVNELKAELSDVREERDELAAQVEQYEEREEAYEAAAQEFAGALADSGETVLDEEELVDRFDVAELAAKVDETESATLADTEPSVQSGGGETDTETASLSEAEQKEVVEHREAIAELAGQNGTVFKHERQRRAELIAEKTGEDPETILEQEE